MPIYEYKCKKCDECFSILQWGSINDDVICPRCNSNDVKKQISSFSSSCSIGSGSSGSSSGGSSSGFSGGG
jgi:putative FmdB family regulatory protein